MHVVRAVWVTDPIDHAMAECFYSAVEEDCFSTCEGSSYLSDSDIESPEECYSSGHPELCESLSDHEPKRDDVPQVPIEDDSSDGECIGPGFLGTKVLLSNLLAKVDALSRDVCTGPSVHVNSDSANVTGPSVHVCPYPCSVCAPSCAGVCIFTRGSRHDHLCEECEHPTNNVMSRSKAETVMHEGWSQTNHNKQIGVSPCGYAGRLGASSACCQGSSIHVHDAAPAVTVQGADDPTKLCSPCGGAPSDLDSDNGFISKLKKSIPVCMGIVSEMGGCLVADSEWSDWLYSVSSSPGWSRCGNVFESKSRGVLRLDHNISRYQTVTKDKDDKSSKIRHATSKYPLRTTYALIPMSRKSLGAPEGNKTERKHYTYSDCPIEMWVKLDENCNLLDLTDRHTFLHPKLGNDFKAKRLVTCFKVLGQTGTSMDIPLHNTFHCGGNDKVVSVIGSLGSHPTANLLTITLVTTRLNGPVSAPTEV